jgi:aryl-alcohol dehydrogenase-like predicted oxidoreductase
VICTKFGYWAPGYQRDHSADRIEEAVELSLSRLRTDYLDVLLMHSPPYELMDGHANAHFKVLQRLVDSGVIRAYGVADEASTVEEMLRIVESTGSTAMETKFNPLHQRQLDVLATAAEAGVGLIVRVPLESGWLTGKHDATSTFEGNRATWWTRDQIAEAAALVEEFGALLPTGVRMSHGALRFILAQPEVSTVIPGAKSVAQVQDNAAAADGTLSPRTVEAIRHFGTRRNLFWR